MQVRYSFLMHNHQHVVTKFPNDLAIIVTCLASFRALFTTPSRPSPYYSAKKTGPSSRSNHIALRSEEDCSVAFGTGSASDSRQLEGIEMGLYTADSESRKVLPPKVPLKDPPEI